MAINEVMGLTLELEANTDKFVKDLQKAAGKVDVGFDSRGLVKSFSSAQKDIKGVFAKTVADAATLGFSKAKIDKLTKKMSPLTDRIESSMKAVFNAQVKLQSAQARDMEKSLKERIVKEHKAAVALEQEKLSALNHRYDFEKKATDRLLDRRKRAIQDAETMAARTRGEAAEEFGKGIADAFTSIKSGDIASVLKQLGKSTATRGTKMEMKGAAQGGGMGKVASTMGKLMAKLGPVIVAMGALAAGMGAIIGIIMGVDAAASALNNSLFESGMAAGELDNQLGGLGSSLKRVRQTFSGSFSFNRMWGTTAKDHLEILGAYAKAGHTFREITAGVSTAADEMDRLKAATTAALVYSKLLGTTSVEMAEIFATRMEEMGTNIDGVQQSLSAVHMAARESGFGVKRFFNMVLQATSGMSMYNVRMEEAAGLLMRLGDILGSKTGGNFLQGLTKGFTDESTQDKYKRVKLTGAGRTKATFKRSAASTADKFLKDLTGKKLGDDFAAAASRAGLKVNFSNSKELVKDLGKLTATQQTDLLGEARRAGDASTVRELTKLMSVSKGAKGGVGNMAMNLGGLDMGGKLMMKLEHGMAVLGKPLHMITDPQELMAFESITGTSGEAALELRRVSQALYGNHAALERLEGLNKEGNLYAGKSKVEIGQMKEDQVKAYGAFVENGKKYTAKLGKDGRIDKESVSELTGGVKAYVQSQGDAFAKAAEKSKPEDIKLAKQQIDATTSISKILEQGIEWLMEQLYSVVSKIWGWLQSPTEGGKRAAAEAAGKAALAASKARKEGRKIDETLKKGGLTSKEVSALKEKKKTTNLAQSVAGIHGAKTKDEDTETLGFWGKMVAKAGPWEAQSKSGDQVGAAAMSKMTVEELREAYKEAGIDPEATAKKFATLTAKQVSAVYGTQFGHTGPEPFTGRMAQGQVFSGAARGLGENKFQRDKVAKRTGRTLDMELWRAKEGKFKLDEKQALLLGAGFIDPTAFKDLLYTGARQVFGQSRMGNIGDAGGKIIKGDDGTRVRSLSAEEVQDKLGGVIQAIDEDKKGNDKLFANKQAKGAKAIAEAQGPVLEKQLKAAEKRRVETEIANILDKAGITKSYRQIGAMASQAVEGKSPFTKEMLSTVTEHGDSVAGIPDKTVADALRESNVLATPKANDFLMQVGQGGRVKFAQRIDSADQVTALAHKPGGAVSKAGSGGSSVVINSFGNSAEVVRGIQAAAAAGVL